MSFQIQAPSDFKKKYEDHLQSWKLKSGTPRLWKKDKTLWTNTDEEARLGWLDIVSEQRQKLLQFKNTQKAFKSFKAVALLGMGGSSLCPEVLTKTFGSAAGFPVLHVLDSTNPDQINHFQELFNLKYTAFIVSSKSGSTLEPNLFLDYFLTKVKKAGLLPQEHFFAITDPGSALEKRAQQENFCRIFYGRPDIGGRFSALSDFGIIPAAALGIDLEKYLGSVEKMSSACRQNEPLQGEDQQNPGVQLGAFLATAYALNKDKIVFLTSEKISSFPSWIEQLLAESTGKEGKGLIPFVERGLNLTLRNEHTTYVVLSLGEDVHLKKLSAMLAQNQKPVMTLQLSDLYDLAGEFFRWEFGTTVCGSFMEINPFDQPDVEESKIHTKKLTEEFQKTGRLPSEPCLYEDSDVQIYRKGSAGGSAGEIMREFFSQVKDNSYIGLLSYVDMNVENQNFLEEIKAGLEKKLNVPVTIQFGPRFLHSTGQAFKGGPRTGVFLQITAEPDHDLRLPEQNLSFGLVESAQSRGDFEVLAQRSQQVLRVHLKKGAAAGLQKLIPYLNG